QKTSRSRARGNLGHDRIHWAPARARAASASARALLARNPFEDRDDPARPLHDRVVDELAVDPDRGEARALGLLERGNHLQRPGMLLGARGKYLRSEERRVGKECRSRWSPEH